MQLSDDELKVTLSNSSGWNNVRCVCPLSPSYNYVEFKADNGPNMMIGVVDGDCGRNAYAGQFSNGYRAHSALFHLAPFSSSLLAMGMPGGAGRGGRD